jgi:alkanesulfonate monooxygenase
MIDFGWFLPTMGDGETIGPPTRKATLDYLVDVAQAAEAAGFTFALVPVGTACQDAWLASAVVAGRTSTLRFLVAMRPGFIAPTLAAKMATTFDQLTQGRVLVNVVTGGYPAELAADGDFTEHDERYERTQEFMQVVRKAWTTHERWGFDGKYYRVEGGNVLPRPYQQPYPPFYFGGASEAARAVGAEEADVYLVWGEPPAMVAERIDDMRQRAANVGRELRFGLRVHVVVRETEDEAWAAAESLIADIPEGYQNAMDRVLSRTDSEGERRQQQIRKSSANGGDGAEELLVSPNLWAGIGKARVGVGTALVGSGENVAARLREYVDLGVDTFILSGYPHLEEAQRFGHYVMPHFVGERVDAPSSAGS